MTTYITRGLDPEVPFYRIVQSLCAMLSWERIMQGSFAFSSLCHRVLKAPPAATKPLPVAAIIATMEASVCPPLSQARHSSVPASVALGALTV